jgi:hypothetical protein
MSFVVRQLRSVLLFMKNEELVVSPTGETVPLGCGKDSGVSFRRLQLFLPREAPDTS